jgi:hypothetical protein
MLKAFGPGLVSGKLLVKKSARQQKQGLLLSVTPSAHKILPEKQGYI